MGVDIGNFHANWSGWRLLFDLGVAFGWEPGGTAPQKMVVDDAAGTYVFKPDDGAPMGYFTNDYQRVIDADAKAWSDALYRALDVIEGRAAAPDKSERIWANAGGDCVALAGFVREFGQRRLPHRLIQDSGDQILPPFRRSSNAFQPPSNGVCVPTPHTPHGRWNSPLVGRRAQRPMRESLPRPTPFHLWRT
jgi:hypothetical protein